MNMRPSNLQLNMYVRIRKQLNELMLHQYQYDGFIS